MKFILVFTAAGAASATIHPSSAQSAKVDFLRDIQPIFQANCWRCHGEQKASGQLRLDNKAATMKGGISGAVIIPGDSKASRLLRRVRGEGGEKRMPLGGESLKPEQIELLIRWIDEGAAWPEGDGATGRRGDRANEPLKHWAFVKPIRSALPVVQNASWVRTPVDAFVLARLEKEGLTPAPEADRITLLRRLSLDLIGLPPTVEEVDAFLADKSPKAYERQVERLLASPHYGERWGRLWLDAARYADSDGYEKDKSRQVWFYRDWVINAFNQDKPYDQFIIEQIAGDLLQNATQDQIVATGFLRNSMINQEGGVDPEQFRMEAMFDRMDAVGKSILGLTIQCAQCHNHKFDPLKQEEYYRMFAFLNNSHEANVAVYTPEEQIKRAEIYRRVQEVEADLQHRAPDWPRRMAAWEETIKGNPSQSAQWTIIQPQVDEISTDGQRYLPMKDGSFLADGYAPAKHRVKMTLKTDVQNITAFRLELLNDPNLPRGGPGRSPNGSCALSEFEVTAAPAGDPKKITKLKIAKATADVAPPERELDPIFNDKSGKRRLVGPIDFAIDGKEETAWTIDVGPALRNQPRKAVFALEQPVANEGGTILTFYLSQKHGGWNNNDNQQNQLGRLRLSLTTATNAEADPMPAGVREILSIPREHRTPAQQQAVFSYWRTTVGEWREANAEIDRLWAQYPKGSTQLVLNERAEMRESHLLKRGDFLRPDKTVAPGVPAFLHPLPPKSNPDQPDRLTFARWLANRDSPTTARSIVNRIWQTYFGTGLVATSEDFGMQGEVPSHPELLDWLAVELMEGRYGTGSSSDRVKPNNHDLRSNPLATARGSDSVAWSLKNIHRLIVNSATYRQSSTVTPEVLAHDPANRLLARGARFRVDAELVRDIALSASGLLNPRVGGPSVYPPAPGFLFDRPFSYGPKVWNEEKGENRYRRAIYTFRYRSVPYPVLQTFDAPTGDVSCVRRTRSNSPLQALATLNETLFVEAARTLALNVVREGGATDRQRMVYAFRRVLSRVPTEAEFAELLGLFNRQKERLLAGELNASALVANDSDQLVSPPKGVTTQEWAAWTTLSRVLLNLDEAITRE